MYALNLGIFALVSEVPFDLAFAGKPFYLNYQNVFLHSVYRPCDDDFPCRRLMKKSHQDGTNWRGANWKVSIGKLLVIVAACTVATLLKTDYSAMGILTIVLMYNLRNNKMYCIGIGCAVLTLLSLNEITCFLAMIPVHFYNGKRGLNLKYPFMRFIRCICWCCLRLRRYWGWRGLRLFKKRTPGSAPAPPGTVPWGTVPDDTDALPG